MLTSRIGCLLRSAARQPLTCTPHSASPAAASSISRIKLASSPSSFPSAIMSSDAAARSYASDSDANNKDAKRPKSNTEMSQYLQQSHDRIFANNRAWAEQKSAKDPGYFAALAEGQAPEYLWIGCSDSRIPAEQITGLEPGQAFVHRNIANLVVNTDLNVMSVVNYAVRHLGVKHIVVCGHYGCGGVKAAMTPKDLGLLNPWLRNIRDVYRLHEAELDTYDDDTKRYERLVELNVIEQCRNIIKTAAVQQSYLENEYPIVHGWVFNFQNGLLKDLEINFESVLADIQKIYDLTK